MSIPPNLSPRALQLILDFEVGGGELYYKSRLSHPSYPGAASGVTIGIGYDLGYVEVAEFARDWEALSESHRERLSDVVGLKGYSARMRIHALADIVIPWRVALAVFESRTISKYIKQTVQAFPGCELLPPDAFGALVSLVFNRGPGISGARRREMAEIARLCARTDVSTAAKLAGIAGRIRAMKRLWYDTEIERGMTRRRNAEAALVESAVAS